MSYQAPDWARTPESSHEWSLLEIKGGVEARKYPLHLKACTVLGRAADQVDIPLQHESTSRQHARIAFDSQGFPWLRDLQSTHGTTCNKRPLPSLAIGRTESNTQTKGSRGIMIFPGDILQFGASTRLFCVEGPPQFERGVFQAQQKQLEQIRKEQKQAEDLRERLVEASDEAVEPVQKDVPMDAQVPEKHRKMLERLNAAKYKLENLQTEDERIRRKGELTEGQEKQLQRNAEREKVLMQTIETVEAELYDKLHPEHNNSSVLQKHHKDAMEDYEDDDFYDRTKRVEESVIEDGESEQTLIEKWTQLQAKCKEQLSTALPSAQAQFDRVMAQHDALEASEDTEEVFFIQNDIKLAKESLKKVSQAIDKHEKYLTEIEKILGVVNSKVKFDRISGFIGVGDPPAPKRPEVDGPPKAMAPPPRVQQPTSMAPPPSRSLPSSSSNDSMKNSFPMPRPPSKRAAVSPQAPEMDGSSEAIMPPPKRQLVGPAMPAPKIANIKVAAGHDSPSSLPPKKVQTNRASGTLAFLSNMNKVEKSNGKSLPLNSAVGSNHKKLGFSPDATADTWRAPADQDGSGQTKLNAKFAGRY